MRCILPMFASHCIRKQCLGAGLPGVEIFLLLRCQGINMDAHGMQLETRNLFVDARWQCIDTRLQLFGMLTSIYSEPSA